MIREKAVRYYSIVYITNITLILFLLGLYKIQYENNR